MVFVKHENKKDTYVNYQTVNRIFATGEKYIGEIETGNYTVFIRYDNNSGYRFKLIDENIYTLRLKSHTSKLRYMTLKEIQSMNISEYDTYNIEKNDFCYYRTHFKTIQDIRKEKITKFFSKK